MDNEQVALDLLKAIDETTTAQGAILAEEGQSLQTISNNLDTLIAAQQEAGASQAVINALTAEKEKVLAISASLGQQAAFSKALASKGVANPVPLPVPPATQVAPVVE